MITMHDVTGIMVNRGHMNGINQLFELLFYILSRKNKLVFIGLSWSIGGMYNYKERD